MAVKPEKATTKVVKTEHTKAADATEAPAAPESTPKDGAETPKDGAETPTDAPGPGPAPADDVTALAEALGDGALPAGDGVHELEPDPELEAFTVERAANPIYAGNSTFAARRAARLAREAGDG